MRRLQCVFVSLGCMSVYKQRVSELPAVRSVWPGMLLLYAHCKYVRDFKPKITPLTNSRKVKLYSCEWWSRRWLIKFDVLSKHSCCASSQSHFSLNHLLSEFVTQQALWPHATIATSQFNINSVLGVKSTRLLTLLLQPISFGSCFCFYNWCDGLTLPEDDYPSGLPFI